MPNGHHQTRSLHCVQGEEVSRVFGVSGGFMEQELSKKEQLLVIDQNIRFGRSRGDSSRKKITKDTILKKDK